MEGRDEKAPVPQQHGLAFQLRQHLDAGADLADTRRADEDAAKWLRVALEHEVGLEARDLPAVRVPLDLEVDEGRVVPIEQDHPGARSEDGRSEAADRLL